MELPKLSGAITSEDVLGKDVIDSEGEFIGVTDKLYLDPKTMELLGVSIDKGFLRSGYVIGTSYIREVAKHAVFLTIRPAFQVRGMSVFDFDGALIGTVQDIILSDDQNTIDAIAVKTKLQKGSILHIQASAIASVGTNIMLKKRVQEILE